MKGLLSMFFVKLKLLVFKVLCIVVELIWCVCIMKFCVLMILNLYIWLVVCSIVKLFLCLLLKWKLLFIIKNLIFSLFISRLCINVLVFWWVKLVLKCIVSNLFIFCVFKSLYFFFNGLICVGVWWGVNIFFGWGLNIIIVVGKLSVCVFLSILFSIVWCLRCILLNLLIVSM